MKIFEEELLEPIARFFRFKKGLSAFPKKGALVIVDLGCGPKIRFFNFMQKNGVGIKKYIGFDPLINEKIQKKYGDNKLISLEKFSLGNKIPLADGSCDIVTGFAFLEHIKNPKQILVDAMRVLKKGGTAIFTTPTPTAKSVLEFLSFKLGLISPREIKEHKNYFTENSLRALLANTGSSVKIKHEYFEMGLNNLIVVRKI